MAFAMLLYTWLVVNSLRNHDQSPIFLPQCLRSNASTRYYSGEAPFLWRLDSAGSQTGTAGRKNVAYTVSSLHSSTKLSRVDLDGCLGV